jgi:hypothetical protein
MTNLEVKVIPDDLRVIIRYRSFWIDLRLVGSRHLISWFFGEGKGIANCMLFLFLLVKKMSY